jgi:hypothetical protein
LSRELVAGASRIARRALRTQIIRDQCGARQPGRVSVPRRAAVPPEKRPAHRGGHWQGGHRGVSVTPALREALPVNTCQVRRLRERAARLAAAPA